MLLLIAEDVGAGDHLALHSTGESGFVCRVNVVDAVVRTVDDGSTDVRLHAPVGAVRAPDGRIVFVGQFDGPSRHRRTNGRHRRGAFVYSAGDGWGLAKRAIRRSDFSEANDQTPLTAVRLLLRWRWMMGFGQCTSGVLSFWKGIDDL